MEATEMRHTNYFNREHLEFSSTVQNLFRFLIDKYGYHLVQAQPTFVRYESDQMFVNVYHGRSSYELGFECGLIAEGEDSRYRLPVIIRGLLGDDHKEQTVFQVSQKESVASCLKKIANLVATYCGPILRGEQSALDRVAEASATVSREIMEEYTIKPIKEQADQAWKNKDYSRVKSLYESVKDHLTSLELKRLEFARKKLEK
jgi:hypothetical protein